MARKRRCSVKMTDPSKAKQVFLVVEISKIGRLAFQDFKDHPGWRTWLYILFRSWEKERRI